MKHTRSFSLEDEVFEKLKTLSEKRFESNTALLTRLIVEEEKREGKEVLNGH